MFLAVRNNDIAGSLSISSEHIEGRRFGCSNSKTLAQDDFYLLTRQDNHTKWRI
jgi:hypothetical protein